MSRKKELKTTIKDELQRMLEAKSEEPSEGRMKLLTLGIKYLAVEAKLEETEYGDFFNDDERQQNARKHQFGDTDTGGPSVEPEKGKKSRTRRNEAGDADPGFFNGGEGSLPS